VQVLPPGVYVAMNGRHFRWDAVRKNRRTGVFEAPADGSQENRRTGEEPAGE
jgi:hypothetical protein